MRTNKYKIPLEYIVILFLFLFTFCQKEEQEILQGQATVFTKDSAIVGLLKAVIDDTEKEQCSQFQYPLVFYIYLKNSQAITTRSIKDDEALLVFFEALNSTDQMSLDFPLNLLDQDGETITIGNLEELEATLTLTLDACLGNGAYEYCDSKNKKVFVCHDGNTLCISINALKAHLDHGDQARSCAN